MQILTDIAVGKERYPFMRKNPENPDEVQMLHGELRHWEGRRAGFSSMIHIAREEFFDTVSEKIRQFDSPVLEERIHGSPETELGKRIRDLVLSMQNKHMRFVENLNLDIVHQREHLVITEEQRRSVDMTYDEFAERLDECGRTAKKFLKMLVGCKRVGRNGANTERRTESNGDMQERMHSLLRWAVDRSLLSLPDQFRFQQTVASLIPPIRSCMHMILIERNRKALEAVEEEKRNGNDVYIPWGGAHIPDIVRCMTQAGWKINPDSLEYTTAYRRKTSLIASAASPELNPEEQRASSQGVPLRC